MAPYLGNRFHDPQMSAARHWRYHRPVIHSGHFTPIRTNASRVCLIEFNRLAMRGCGHYYGVQAPKMTNATSLPATDSAMVPFCRAMVRPHPKPRCTPWRMNRPPSWIEVCILAIRSSPFARVVRANSDGRPQALPPRGRLQMPDESLQPECRCLANGGPRRLAGEGTLGLLRGLCRTSKTLGETRTRI